MKMRLLFVPLALAFTLACPSPPASDARPAVRELVPSLPSDTMIETMVSHSVLTHPRVVPFLHLEIPANVPLKLFAGPDLARGAPKLQAGGKPVQIVPREEARVVLESREDLEGPSYRIHLRIPPEGVVGHVDVTLRDNVWTAVNAKIAER